MTGFLPNMYWIVCWSCVAPLVMGVIFIFSCVQWEPVKYGTVVYPDWAHIIGSYLSINFSIYLECCRFHHVILIHGMDPWLRHLLDVQYAREYERCELE